MPHQIKCINKPHHESSHEAIQRVGGIQGNGQPFNISREECAAHINQGHLFQVHVGNVTTTVETYQRHGTWFIRTHRDATKKDNLLYLPECPK